MEYDSMLVSNFSMVGSVLDNLYFASELQVREDCSDVSETNEYDC